MRVPIAAIAALGFVALTPAVEAQMLGAGMPMPGAAPPQQQMPPCFKDFVPLREEAQKRATTLQNAMQQKKASREEACILFKQFSAAEAKMVKYLQANAEWCGIPAEATKQLKANHSRTLKTQKQVCDGGGMAGAPRPAGPGLSEALGTTRAPGGTLDPLAPQSGTMNTLTGNVLAR